MKVFASRWFLMLLALAVGGCQNKPSPGPTTPADVEEEIRANLARLGPEDLETVDTLITAGIASNRADAVRWTLARIRERPAYEKLRERAREIEELKAQF